MPTVLRTNLVLPSDRPTKLRSSLARRATRRFKPLLTAAIVACTSVDAAVLFTERHARPGGGTLRTFAASDAMLVAAGDGGRIHASPDGVAWTAGNSGTHTWRGASFAAGRFVLVGDGGRTTASTDGLAWSRPVESAMTSTLHAVAFGAGVFVAVGETGTIIKSADGVTWASVSSDVNHALRGIVWDAQAGLFVAAGDGGTILSSPDGTQWTLRESGTTEDLLMLSASPIGFFYAGTSGTLRSGVFIDTPTGHSLQVSRPSPTLAPASWRAVTFHGSPGRFFLAVGGDGAAAGGPGNFRSVESGTGKDLLAAGFARGRFFAVGEHESIFASVPVEILHQRLRNASGRSEVAAADRTLIGGFVITGTGTKRLLIRAGGPSLSRFDVSRPLAQPELAVFDAFGRRIAGNKGWTNAPDADAIATSAAALGAYPFPTDSADSALLLTLAPGAYTAHVTGAVPGVGLLELYDAEVWPTVPTSRLLNLSTRCFVGTDERAAITGISLPAGRRLLIRAIGPTLEQFGVRGVLADPEIELVWPGLTTILIGGISRMPARTVAVNDDWGTTAPAGPGMLLSGTPEDIRAATREAGAFPLPEGSRDAALLVTPGGDTLTLHVRGRDDESGVALVEVYELGESSP